LTPSHSANIAWVNEDRGGGGGDAGVGQGGLDWADDQWRALMEDNGHTVIAHGDPYFLDIDLEEDRLDLLNSADLVIVSRDANSGEYNTTEEEIQLWTEGITVPMLVLTPFHMRSSRWRMVNATGTPLALDHMEVLEPTHPVFEGVELDGGSVEIWDPDVLGDDANINLTDALDVGNGQVLAVESGTEFPWVILWEAGVEFYDGSDTFAGNTRMFFGAGSDEDPISWGEKNITPAGDRIFLNAIDFLTGGDGPLGDFNNNGERDLDDIDILSQAIVSGDSDAKFDLNGDGLVNADDRGFWVVDLTNTYFGDSNFDGEFSSSDFVAVFTTAKYETGQPATFAEGDWNGDKVFSSADFVAAFTGGGYEAGIREGGLQTVPEPSSIVLILFGLSGLARVVRRK
jgi:hypothetical protein